MQSISRRRPWNAPVHALCDPPSPLDSRGDWTGKSWCGRTITGVIGGTIPSGITCGNCRRVMRAGGWQV